MGVRDIVPPDKWYRKPITYLNNVYNTELQLSLSSLQRYHTQKIYATKIFKIGMLLLTGFVLCFAFILFECDLAPRLFAMKGKSINSINK